MKLICQKIAISVFLGLFPFSMSSAGASELDELDCRWAKDAVLLYDSLVKSSDMSRSYYSALYRQSLTTLDRAFKTDFRREGTDLSNFRSLELQPETMNEWAEWEMTEGGKWEPKKLTMAGQINGMLLDILQKTDEVTLKTDQFLKELDQRWEEFGVAEKGMAQFQRFHTPHSVTMAYDLVRAQQYGAINKMLRERATIHMVHLAAIYPRCVR